MSWNSDVPSLFCFYSRYSIHIKFALVLQIIPLASDRAMLGSQLVLLAGQRLHHYLSVSTRSAHHQALTAPAITEWLKSLVSNVHYFRSLSVCNFCHCILHFNDVPYFTGLWKLTMPISTLEAQRGAAEPDTASSAWGYTGIPHGHSPPPDFHCLCPRWRGDWSAHLAERVDIRIFIIIYI